MIGIFHREAKEPLVEQRPSKGAPAVPDSGPPIVASHELLRGGRELIIRHAGTTYRLHRTGSDKLILTK